jgi:hypothetical protein
MQRLSRENGKCDYTPKPNVNFHGIDYTKAWCEKARDGFPASLKTMRPFTTVPNNALCACVLKVTKYLPEVYWDK